VAFLLSGVQKYPKGYIFNLYQLYRELTKNTQ
jgi:hypothetical protein